MHNIHWKIWIIGLLSLAAYFVADFFASTPDDIIPTFLFLGLWIALQLVAAYYTWLYVRNIKHRSGTWITLVAMFGLVGIVIIYLLPVKKKIVKA